MSTAAVSEFTPVRALPNGGVFYSPLGIFPFQARHIAEAYLRTEPGNAEGVAVVWDTGVGKAQPLSEPVLTPTGWRSIGDIRPGDEVFGAAGQRAKVESVHPQEGREVYRVTFSDGSWTRCSPDHLWEVGYWGSDRSSGKQMRVRRTKLMRLRQLLDQGIKTPNGRRKFDIPISEPVQYPPVALPMDPYVLGVVLGDGHIRPDGQVRLSTDREITESIAPDRDPIEQPGCWLLNTVAWRGPLVQLGLAGHRAWEKFVPQVYLRAPVADRRALLAGLLDTDGSPMETGGVEFSTTSRELADGVVELAQSLGGVARDCGERVTNYTHNGEKREGRVSYRINVKLPENPFRLARKAERWVRPEKYAVARHFEEIERIEDEDTVCIKIDQPDGLYLTRDHIVTHNTIFSLILASYLFEDDKIDQVMVVCEQNKIRDWVEDVERFTALSALRYHDAGRQKRLARHGVPHVLVTTHETGKIDLMTRVRAPGRRGRGKATDGPLVEALGLRGKRTLWIFDEPKMRNRSSELYQAYWYLMGALRRPGMPHQRVVALTATPIESDIADAFNLGRFLAPEVFPSVGDFESYYAKGKDDFGNLVFRQDRKEEFSELFRSIMLRKRKTDPDVIHQFPKQIEESVKVAMTRDHRAFYEVVERLLDPPEGEPDPRDEEQIVADERRIKTALRITAGHPAAHLHLDNPISQQIAERIGAEGLRAIGSSKALDLITRLKPLVKGQRAQVIVFSRYTSVIVEAARDLREAGYVVAEYHGRQGDWQNERAKREFLNGGCEILFCSDKAARGLNFKNAQYVYEYDPTSWALHTQRINRVHRIDSDMPSVTATTMVLEDSPEVNTLARMIDRNEDMDTLLGDVEDETEFVSAETRRELLDAYYARRK